MPVRAHERHDKAALSPEALGKRFSAGMRQFSNQHSDVRDMRRLNLPSMSRARNPGASFSTTNPQTRPSSSFAQTTLTSGAFADSSWKKTRDRKSTRLNSSHVAISYAVFCLKKKKKNFK